MDKEMSIKLIEKYIKEENMRKHCLAVGAIMKELASFLNENEEKWEIIGLLHDLDYAETKNNPEKHGLITAKILKDKVDSEILAKLLKGNLIPETYVPPKDIRELREIVRHRQSYVKMRTSLKNQIHAIIKKNNIKIPVKDIFAKKSRIFLEKLNDEKINSYLKMIDHVDAEIKEIKAKAKSIEQFKKQARLIQTMPGLGDTAAYIILAEIGDIHRFKTPSQLCSYAGIVPSISQSGNKCFIGRITKQGSKWLRWIFIQCANVAINKPNKIQK